MGSACKLLEKSMILCDLCGEAKECLQKEIEGKEYDLCTDCWRPLAEKLKGKGRAKRFARRCSCRRPRRQNLKSRSRCPNGRRRLLARRKGRIRRLLPRRSVRDCEHGYAGANDEDGDWARDDDRLSPLHGEWRISTRTVKISGRCNGWWMASANVGERLR